MDTIVRSFNSLDQWHSRFNNPDFVNSLNKEIKSGEELLIVIPEVMTNLSRTDMLGGVLIEAGGRKKVTAKYHDLVKKLLMDRGYQTYKGQDIRSCNLFTGEDRVVELSVVYNKVNLKTVSGEVHTLEIHNLTSMMLVTSK